MTRAHCKGTVARQSSRAGLPVGRLVRLPVSAWCWCVSPSNASKVLYAAVATCRQRDLSENIKVASRKGNTSCRIKSCHRHSCTRYQRFCPVPSVVSVACKARLAVRQKSCVRGCSALLAGYACESVPLDCCSAPVAGTGSGPDLLCMVCHCCSSMKAGQARHSLASSTQHKAATSGVTLPFKKVVSLQCSMPCTDAL